MAVKILSDDKEVIIVMTKKRAIAFGVVLDACLDTVGNITKEDVELTSSQISSAEDDMIDLVGKLSNLEVKS